MENQEINPKSIVRANELVVGEFYLLDYDEVDPEGTWIALSCLNKAVIEYIGFQEHVLLSRARSAGAPLMFHTGKILMLGGGTDELKFDNGATPITFKVGDKVVLADRRIKYTKL